MKVLLVSFVLLSCLNNPKREIVQKEKYSISDINADNYYTLLTENRTTSLNKLTDLSGLFELAVIFFDAKTITNIPGWTVSRSIQDDGALSTRFLNNTNHHLYYLEFSDSTSDILRIVNISSFSTDKKDYSYLKLLLDEALQQLEFTYKESNLKGHPDILIKESSDNFIIGKVTLDANKEILSLSFKIFNREKY